MCVCVCVRVCACARVYLEFRVHGDDLKDLLKTKHLSLCVCVCVGACACVLADAWACLTYSEAWDFCIGSDVLALVSRSNAHARPHTRHTYTRVFAAMLPAAQLLDSDGHGGRAAKLSHSPAKVQLGGVCGASASCVCVSVCVSVCVCGM